MSTESTLSELRNRVEIQRECATMESEWCRGFRDATDNVLSEIDRLIARDTPQEADSNAYSRHDRFGIGHDGVCVGSGSALESRSVLPMDSGPAGRTSSAPGIETLVERE